MSRIILVLVTLVMTGSVTAGPTIPQSVDLKRLRELPVQHDGRWPPLDTLARDVVESVTGTPDFRGHDPMALLLAWTFDADAWMREPLIRIGNAELRRLLELPAGQDWFSFAELVNHEPYMAQFRSSMNRQRGQKPDPLQLKVADIGEQLGTLSDVFSNQTIRFIPHPTDPNGAWDPIAPGTSAKAATAAWVKIGTAFQADDNSALQAGCTELAAALDGLPAAHRPDPALTATELRYNRWSPFGLAWKIMAGAAVLSAVAMFQRRRALDVLAIVGMVAGFGVLTYGLYLRWQVAGRIPASNMYESLLFLSWGMGAFAILAIFVLPHRIVPLTASIMGALALFLSDVLPLDSYVRPIVPVLRDTFWMSIHVPVIMTSYSVLALAMLIAHVQIVVMALAPRRQQWARTIDSTHYWYVMVGSILLWAGIATGSMWGASSWGRYWGWDPKEVWSLIAFLGYTAILHVRLDHERIPRWLYAAAAGLALLILAMIVPRLPLLVPGNTGSTAVRVLALAGGVGGMALLVLVRGQFATAVKSILAFWLIVMTYVGVNFVLGIGLHSYGFGKGAVAWRMLTLGGIDLALVLCCTVIFLIRRHRSEPAFSSTASLPEPAVG